MNTDRTGQQIVSTGYGRFRIEREYDPSVRVPDFVTKCVGFIGEVDHRTSSGGLEGQLFATGFFVSVPCKSRRLKAAGASHVYFVTAKHVADGLKGRETYFLVNDRRGGTLTLQTDNPWWTHPTDPTADVALVQVAAHPDADVISIAVGQLGGPELLRAYDIGIGDEVYVTGLFTEAPGISRNIPILRHGNLAMLPEEQIQTSLGYANVYLVEARSIGGLSGSPVFVRPTLHAKLTNDFGQPVDFLGVGHGATLLGLMLGHWDVRESQINSPAILHDRRGVNLGIGIVVPAEKILETINSQELMDLREEQESIEEQSHVPGVDVATPGDFGNFTNFMPSCDAS